MKKIMVVDDDPEILELIQAYLKGDYKIVLKPDGLDAINSILKENPDLILTDVLMPKMSGEELSKALRRHMTPNGIIPVVVMSAKQDFQKSFNSEFISAFLPKPFNKEQLRSAVEKSIKIKKIRKSNFLNTSREDDPPFTEETRN